ncbi:hypothetical protein [Halorubrum distributum]|uniref:hypothetical protein n=1 Tax=Halorubrum distributum TaxID=29283 RepID=UPI000A91EF95|nr:hypothetical protein [Halorubrum arcis]
MKRRLASPENDWKDFTEDHAELRKELIDAIGDIDRGAERDPIALVGPYRTGKTQLLYETFENAWTDNVPALYTDANTLFNEFDEDGEVSISDWLAERVSEQVEALSNGQTVDWLPNWNHISQKEEFVKELETTDISADQTTVLLVDEIEQAYTRIREAEFVDDDNPLRVLLDDPDGVYQVWAFGLVAAYELGPADYARFQELRVPILDVEDIQNQLLDQRPGVNDQIAPGIWWLSRGRIGWANKLIDEAPDQSADLAKWVRDISTQEFEGLTPINNEVWTENVSSPEWDAARRSILFLDGEYEPWEVREDDVLQSGTAANILTKIILDLQDGLSPDAKQLLEQNVERLLRNIVPITSRSDGNFYIPATTFSDDSTTEAFVNLLSDLILSFEASTEDRAQLINTLEEIDPREIRSEWTSEFFNYIIENGPDEAWIPNLDTINNAYPPVAVDPSRLTDQSSEELQQELESGIRVDPDIQTKASQYEAVFCPTEEILQNQIEEVLAPTNFTKVYVLFTREEVDPETDENLSKLTDLNRVNFVHNPESRLWEFVIHLQQYIEQEHDITGPIQSADVRDVLAEEQARDKRNVISTLFSQIEEIAESETLRAVREFEEQFTREEATTPIWDENLSEGSKEANAPSVRGAGSQRLNALAFSVGISRRNVRDFPDATNIVSILREGEEQAFIDVSGGEFGFSTFIKNTLTQTGIATDLRTFAKRFDHEDTQARDPSVGNLQSLLRILLDLSDITEEEILAQVRKKDPNNEVFQLPPTEGARLRTQLQRHFILGVVVEDVAVRQSTRLPEFFGEPLETLDSMREEFEHIQNKIDVLNDDLQPPDGFGAGVELVTDPIQARAEHIDTLATRVDELLEYLDEDDEFGGVGVMYLAILDAYLTVFEEEIRSVRSTVHDTDLFNVKDLKGTFSLSLELLDEASTIYLFTEYSEPDAKNKVEEFGEEAFDFEAVQGGGKINPVNEEALKPIDEHAKEKEKDLRVFNQKFRQLQREVESMQTKQGDLRDQISEFSNTVQSEEVSD